MSRVYKVTLFVLDPGDSIGGEGELCGQLENLHHPEFVTVMDIQSREVQWNDDHPLNKKDTQREAFDKLFKFDGNDLIGENK